MTEPNLAPVLKVLVACEESQRVAQSFRDLGHEAYSCDLLPQSGGHPEWHIHGDCLVVIDGHCDFDTEDGTSHRIDSAWDILIAHPPCTYLTNTQMPWYNREKYGDAYVDDRLRKREDAVRYFMRFANAKCDHIAIENPVGHMSTRYRKPS